MRQPGPGAILTASVTQLSLGPVRQQVLSVASPKCLHSVRLSPYLL